MIIFWMPAIASAVMLFAAGRAGLITRTPRLIVWFGIALTLQVVGDTLSPAWAVGLVLQVVLAIYLAVQIKLG